MRTGLEAMKIVGAVLLFAAPLHAAQAQGSVAPSPTPAAKPLFVDMVANVPRPSALQVVGDAAAPTKREIRDDPKVQGGKALRIALARRGANPWDVNVVSPSIKPVKAGTGLVLAFWARVAKADGGASVTIPTAAVQITTAPYSSLFGGPMTIGPEWKLHKVEGRADKDYAPGALAASIHLATGRQTVDFGPVFIVDVGPDAS